MDIDSFVNLCSVQYRPIIVINIIIITIIVVVVVTFSQSLVGCQLNWHV